MKKYRNEIIIVIFNLFIVSLFCFTNIFGSTMDFLTQHIVFPNYLRELFYSSGKIIPSFMIHIGGGQNIFNTAYYGLLNPIILFSYLFPFIKMVDYIVLSNIILMIISNLLFYKFVYNKFDDKLSLVLTFLFMLSGPLIFQFHRQFMFINYMPFLILALINIDKCRWNRVIIDVFLIVMISFYFSIPSILVIVIYYIYVNYNCLNFKKFLKFIFYIFISILMSSILLLPIFYSIISSRMGSGSFSFSLLIPNIDLDNILYGGYGVGLTSIGFISLIYLLYSKNRKNIFLFIVVSLICFLPICLYLLNGGLYLRSKCLIPLLPLFVYIIGLFLNDLFSGNIDLKSFSIFIILSNVIVLIRYHVLVYYLDLLFMILLIVLYNKFGKKNIVLIPLVILNLVICICYNKTENYISYDYYNEINNDYYIDTNYRVSNLNSDTVNMSNGNYISSIYSSTQNKYLNNLYHNVFKVNNSEINNLSLTSTSNVLFNQFLGNKYIIGDGLSYPYEYQNGVYVLEQVLPIGYVNSNTVNKEYFDSLEYPYNLDILLNYIIDSDSNNYPVSKVEEVNLNYTYELGSNVSIVDDKLYVYEDSRVSVNITDDLSDKILFISLYDQVEQEQNISMSINGQINLLTKTSWIYPNHNNTFNFCISGSDKLDVHFSKGVYNVGNIRMYVLDNRYIENINSHIDEFNIEVMNTELIKGNINVTNSGYFILKIPYDNGFKIKVNGDIINYSLIDDAFIGFYLDKGFYDIEITYMPPYLIEGMAFSIIGFIMFICLFKRREK